MKNYYAIYIYVHFGLSLSPISHFNYINNLTCDTSLLLYVVSGCKTMNLPNTHNIISNELEYIMFCTNIGCTL